MTPAQRRIALSAAAGAVAACALLPGGLLFAGWPGDVIYYSHVGAKLVAGLVPYHEFYLEYPPGSLPVFWLPAAISEEHYIIVFKLLMTACAAGAVYAALSAGARAGLAGRSFVRAALVLAAAPLALGPLFLNRYDAWPALLVALGVLALGSGRTRLAIGVLAFAVVAKIYAVALLPIAAVHIARTRGRDELVRCAAVAAGVVLVTVLPFAAVGFGGLGFSFYIQATRHLQVESLGAQLLVALDHLGLYRTHTVVGSPGSFDLPGRLADVVGVLSSIVEVAAVLAVAAWYGRGRPELDRLLLACAAAITGFIALGKVLSPQYLVWLVPVVPVIRNRLGDIASAVLVLALLMTQFSFYDSDGVADLTPISWLVLARNLVLVGLFVLLVRSLRRRVTT